MKSRLFPLLALAVSLACVRLLVAQDGAPKPEEAKPAAGSAPRLIDVRWELYSLPQKEAHALLRKFSTDAERYAEILRRADAGDANLEELQLARTRSGRSAKVEAILEKIYPTEFEPPEIPEPPKSEDGSAPEKLSTPEATKRAEHLAPTSFETRNVGVTVEFAPTLGPDGETVDLSMQPDIVTYLGDDKIAHPDVGWAQPRFQSQRASWAITIKSGQTMLVGTLSPPADTAIPAPATEKVVWLSFVRVDVVPVN